MNPPNRNNSITRTEITRRHKLTAIMHRTFRTSRSAGDAVAEHRQARLRCGIHHTIKTYLRDLCSIGRSRHIELATPGGAIDERSATKDVAVAGLNTQMPEPRPQLTEVPNALPRGWEQALQAFGQGDTAAADVRLTLYRDRHPADAAREPAAQRQLAAAARAGDTIPMLRWLLIEATGTIADVAHQLETRAAEIDDDARLELQDDLSVLDEELVIVKALLAGAIDWDEENRRLLAGEIPPLESEADDAEDV